jgi:UDP-N-acetyl-alpha-D-muramoyl-L-alanyl-L-glutamate epimerase
MIPVLYHHYNYLVLAHERSANTGNLYSKELEKEVNHQWGKSYEAESMLNHFITKKIVSNFQYFSILQPIYDFRIFKNISKYPECIDKIHSCNINKPWCKNCPKCAYVWIGLIAHFDVKLVNQVFQENLFDSESLQTTFLELMGFLIFHF